MTFYQEKCFITKKVKQFLRIHLFCINKGRETILLFFNFLIFCTIQLELFGHNSERQNIHQEDKVKLKMLFLSLPGCFTCNELETVWHRGQRVAKSFIFSIKYQM